MKIKPLVIIFEPLQDFKERTKTAIQSAVRSNKTSLQQSNVLKWSSVESYQHFMNDQKYSILAAIFKYQPKSIYQLAKILDRAQQNVARDCSILGSHGFITFEKSLTGRKTKAPRLAFDYNAILIHLPALTYKVEFEEAA